MFSNQDTGRINVFGNNVIIAYYNCVEDKILPWNMQDVHSIINLHDDVTIKVEVFNVSLDRIDSSKDYVLGNIQLVLKEVNYMKQSLSQEDFINICKKISNHNV